jgi:hypothetical protein
VARGLCLFACALSVACSASPEGFIRAWTRQDCRYLKKCDRGVWTQTGYSTVVDCRSARIPNDEIDDFVEKCGVYDPDAGRACLAAKREAVRECDREAAPEEDREACERVCSGDPQEFD